MLDKLGLSGWPRCHLEVAFVRVAEAPIYTQLLVLI